MGKRIEYIDYLRGLSVMWVVWYHTEHPAFVDYSFRIPLFFFVSGIFFKPYQWNVFWRKKVNQLIIPFILFYVIYYVYLIVTNALKFHSLEVFDYSSFWGLFHCYRGYDSFVVNPPLWFICALINLQLLLYFFSLLFRNKAVLVTLAVFLSLIGVCYIKNLPTPFMFGRSIPYFVYYVLGFVFGKELLKHLELKTNELKLLIYCGIIFTCVAILKNLFLITGVGLELINYPQIMSLILLLVVFFKYAYKLKFFYPFKYFGMNSYIVLGMHEVYQTSLRIIFENTIGTMTVTLGIIQTFLSLLLLWPTIYLFNKYIPSLVAKKEFIIVPKS